ncbi:MAG: tetratricopeptide repeat protein [Minicystis sp.]
MALFLLGFVLRAALVLGEIDFPLFRVPILDMEVHDRWARAIAAGDLRGGPEPFFRAPLYPYFLGVLYWISGGSMLFARLVQAAIGGGTCALVYAVAREAFGDRRVAVLAGVLQATLWTAIYFDVELLLVPLEMFFDLAALLALLRARKGNIRHYALAGLWLGLGAITRPNILAFAVALAPLLFFLRTDPLRVVARRLAVLYLAAAAVIAPVTVRNRIVGGEAVLIATQGGVNLYIGNNPRADGITAIVPGTRADWWGGYHDAIHQAEQEAGRPLRPSEVDAHYRRKALAFWRESPGQALRLLGRKIYYLTHAFEPGNNFDGNYLRSRMTLLRFDPVSLYLVLPFAYLGLGLCARRAREVAPLYAFVGIYAASIAIFFVNDKLRMPLAPVLCIFAAAAVFWLWDRARPLRASRPLAGAVGALVAAAAYAWVPPYPEAAERMHIQARSSLGELYQRLGDLDAAREEIEGALALDPNNADTLARLGTVYMGQRDGARAEAAYQRAIAVDPRNLPALSNLGVLHLRKGEHAEAQVWLERALAVSPRSAAVKSYLAQALAAQGHVDEARAHLREAIRDEPNHDPARLLLGDLALASGALGEAEEAYRGVLARDPNHLAALGGLAQVAHHRGAFAEAARAYGLYLDRANPADPNVPRVRYLRACVLAQAGQLDAAVEELRAAFRRAPPAVRGEAARDPELAPLRGHPGFEALVAR